MSEKSAKLKLNIRNLPYTVNEEAFRSFLKDKHGLESQAVRILQFTEGQAPSRYKKVAGNTAGGAMGGAALPAWASVQVKNVTTREELVKKVDAQPFDSELFPTLHVAVEFSPWERVSFSRTPKEKIQDDEAGQIFEDSDFLAYCDALMAAEEDPVGSSAAPSLESWLQEASVKEKEYDPSKKPTGLVNSLIGKWYHGKKMPWELLAEEEADDEDLNRRGSKKDGKKLTRKERRKLAKEEKRAKKKAEKKQRRQPNREQQLVAEVKEDIRKEERKEQRKREKEQKKWNKEQKLARIERQERKKEVIRSTGGSSASTTGGGKDSGEKKGNKFTVSSAKSLKAFPTLPGQDTAPVDEARPPRKEKKHSDPTASAVDVPAPRSVAAPTPGFLPPPAAPPKPKMKIMKREKAKE